MTIIQKALLGLSHVNLSKGTTVFKGEVPGLKELEMFTTSLKRNSEDVISITHRVRQTGKSPYCVADIQVKDKEGNLVDRLFASLSDWTANGQAYSCKWRKGSIAAKKSEEKVAQDIIKKDTKDIKPNNETPSDKLQDKVKHKKDGVEQELQFNENNTDVIKKEAKDIKPTKDTPTDKKLQDKKKSKKDAVEQEIPFDKHNVFPGNEVPPPRPQVIEYNPNGLEPHPTQYIPNIRDYEIDGLLDKDVQKRLETIAALGKDGRQAFFNPMTGKPNVFWSFNREEALNYFLELLGRK